MERFEGAHERTEAPEGTRSAKGSIERQWGEVGGGRDWNVVPPHGLLIVVREVP